MFVCEALVVTAYQSANGVMNLDICGRDGRPSDRPRPVRAVLQWVRPLPPMPTVVVVIALCRRAPLIDERGVADGLPNVGTARRRDR